MSNPEEPDDSSEAGEWQRRDPEDLLAFMQPGEPYGTGELAEALGWPRRTVLHVLDRLADDGQVVKKKPEPRRAIWMLVEE